MIQNVSCPTFTGKASFLVPYGRFSEKEQTTPQLDQKALEVFSKCITNTNKALIELKKDPAQNVKRAKVEIRKCDPKTQKELLSLAKSITSGNNKYDGLITDLSKPEGVRLELKIDSKNEIEVRTAAINRTDPNMPSTMTYIITKDDFNAPEQWNDTVESLLKTINKAF